MNNIKYIVVAPSPCMMNIQHPILIYKNRTNKHKYFKTHRKAAFGIWTRDDKQRENQH